MATNVATEKTMRSRPSTCRAFATNQMKQMMNRAKLKTWKARPASKILLGTLGSLPLEYAEPTSAAPVIWITVATASQTMKTQRITLGGSGEYCRPTRLIITDMRVYMAAE